MLTRVLVLALALSAGILLIVASTRTAAGDDPVATGSAVYAAGAERATVGESATPTAGGDQGLEAADAVASEAESDAVK